MNPKTNRAGKRNVAPTSTGPARPEKLGEILSRLFAARGWGRRHERLRLGEAWSEAVGQRASGHTRVRALRRGVFWSFVGKSDLLPDMGTLYKTRPFAHMRRRLGRPTPH